MRTKKYYINIEGEVYSLSLLQYQDFRLRVSDALYEKGKETWSDLLHWVMENGKREFNVETYNF